MSRVEARRRPARRLRLSYSLLADLVTGQIGEPGLPHLVPLAPGVVGYFRRDDPADLMGFQIESFSEALPRLEPWLEEILGPEVMAELRALGEMPPPELPEIEALDDEQLEGAFERTTRRVDKPIPEAAASVRRARARLMLAWREEFEAERAAVEEVTAEGPVVQAGPLRASFVVRLGELAAAAGPQRTQRWRFVTADASLSAVVWIDKNGDLRLHLSASSTLWADGVVAVDWAPRPAAPGERFLVPLQRDPEGRLVGSIRLGSALEAPGVEARLDLRPQPVGGLGGTDAGVVRRSVRAALTAQARDAWGAVAGRQDFDPRLRELVLKELGEGR